ncbi:MAG: hypothetical protein H6741_11580 [Alphaproteobacteria bacterium]|nr:hypothetical protein [Alphaproteobacteria bacterium]
MTHPTRASALILALLGLTMAGCQGKDDLPFAPATDRTTSDDSGLVTGDDTGPSDDTGIADDSGSSDDSGESSGNLDEEGDIYNIGINEDEVSLADSSGDSNLDQDFFLIAVNSSNSDGGYRLRYTAASSGAGGPPPPSAQGIAEKQSSPLDLRQRQHRAEREPVRAGALTPAPFDQSDIGSARQTFNVNNAYEGDETSPVRAKLWAIGDYVSIWVDDEVPIDWDFNCDGVIDVPADFNAYGFNNCDLQTVADIADNNVIVNLRALFGDESDINGDGKVSVVITPVLNTVPLSSEEEDDWSQVVSYADPVTDLNEFNEDNNPGSDEQEVIYVFAPDPYGFYNPFFPTTVAEYTSMGLQAEIARSFLKLILYNTHVLSYEPDTGAEDTGGISSAGQPEDAWLTEVLGAIAADYCGFGAVYFSDAWRYLDASYLFSLTAFDQDSLFAADSRGAQYLFGLWLMEVYGEDLLPTLAQTEYIGVDNVEAATGTDFESLIRDWQIAMLVTDVTNSSGDALVDTEDSGVSLYSQAETISAPTTAPETPAAGIFYGANGHQRGFNIRGPNRWIEGGTTSSPIENTTRRVVANGPDFHTYTPGFNFYGYTAGGYGSHFVRMTRLEYVSAAIEIQSNVGSGEGDEAEGIFGAVVRWRDPGNLDNAVDNIYSPLDVNATVLPALPTDGTEIYAFGDIGNLVNTQLVSTDDDVSTGGVDDTDRYLLDLTDRTTNELVQVAIWLDRRFINTAGQVGPNDPWLAVVPEDDLPTPTVNGYNSATCPTSDSTWAYPNSMLNYVFTQVFLSSTLYVDGDFDIAGATPEAVCGVYTGGLACEDDWDRDGVADGDEPQPVSFVQQVLVEQCQDNGGTLPNEYITDDWLDIDSLDDDDLPSYSVVYNIGGRSGEDGEEAMLVTTLYGGNRYVVVVGGGGDQGAYELSFKQLN